MNARLYIYHLVDIADELDVKKLKKHLKKLKVRPLRLSRFTPAYLNFAIPPVEMNGNPWILRHGDYMINSGEADSKNDDIAVNTNFKFYSLGSVTVRYEITVAGENYGEIFTKSREILNNYNFGKKTDFLITEIRKLIDKELEIKTYRGFLEDYDILWIQDNFNPETLEINKRSIAQFLRNETLLLSEYEQNEAYRYRFSYTSNDLTVIDWDRAVTISSKPDDDVWDVLEYVNLQSLELRYYDSELDKRLEEIYKFAKKKQFSLIEFYQTPRLLKKTLKIFIDFAEVEERINGFLKLTGDEYLSRVYQAAAIRLNIRGTQAEIKERLIDTRDLYEVLAHNSSAVRTEILEAIIIFLIAFEIISALIK